MITSALVWLKRIRNIIGFLGMLLPWVALLGAFLVSKFGCGIKHCFWEDLSISATYYVTPALTGILTTAAIVLMCYDGYDRKDDIVTTLAGVCGLLIVLFPCDCCIIKPTDCVGMFQLKAENSHIIHSVSAVCFFLLLSYMSICRFTKTRENKENEQTEQKLTRNTIYRICGYGMLAALVFIPLPIRFPAKTFIVEAIALTFFGISWLVKGQAFGLLADEE